MKPTADPKSMMPRGNTDRKREHDLGVDKILNFLRGGKVAPQQVQDFKERTR